MAHSDDLIKDLGIYGIKLSVALNSGALGIILSKESFWVYSGTMLLYLIGLFFSSLSVGVTYFVAQKNRVGKYRFSEDKHLVLMMSPVAFSFFLFFTASILAIF